jgi:hypothetical protein
MRQPEGSFGVQTQLARISIQLSFPSTGKHVQRPLAWRRPLSASVPRKSTGGGRSRTVRNLPTPGKWPQRTAASQTGIGSAIGPSKRSQLHTMSERSPTRCQSGSPKTICAGLAIPDRPGGRSKNEIERLADRYVSSRVRFPTMTTKIYLPR